MIRRFVSCFSRCVEMPGPWPETPPEEPVKPKRHGSRQTARVSEAEGAQRAFPFTGNNATVGVETGRQHEDQK